MLANQDDPLSGVSRWVIEIVEEVNSFLGMSFKGVERQARELFTALEGWICHRNSSKGSLSQGSPKSQFLHKL